MSRVGGCETCLQVDREGDNFASLQSWFGAQVGEIDVGLATVNDGVGVFARPLCPHPVCHRHKSISLALSRVAISDHNGLLNGTKLVEEPLEGIICGVVRQSPNEDLRQSGVSVESGHLGESVEEL